MMGVNSRKHYFTTNKQQITDNYNGKQNKTKQINKSNLFIIKVGQITTKKTIVKK